MLLKGRFQVPATGLMALMGNKNVSFSGVTTTFCIAWMQKQESYYGNMNRGIILTGLRPLAVKKQYSEAATVYFTW